MVGFKKEFMRLFQPLWSFKLSRKDAREGAGTGRLVGPAEGDHAEKHILRSARYNLIRAIGFKDG